MSVPTWRSVGAQANGTGSVSVSLPDHDTNTIMVLAVQTSNETVTLSSANSFSEISSSGTGLAPTASSVASFLATSIGSLGDTNTRSDYTCTLSRAPTASALVLVAVNTTDTPGGSVFEPSSVSGAGMVFTIVSSVSYAPLSAGTQKYNVSLWRGMSLTPTGSLVTIHYGASRTGCDVLVTEISGTSTSGTSGANAVGASATSVTDGSSALTIVGASASSTVNAWFSVLGVATQTAVDTPGQNWTSLASVAHGTPIAALFSGWTTRSTGTTAAWSGSGSRERGGILVELVADNGNAGADATRLTAFWCRATGLNNMSSPVIADPGNHVLAVITGYDGCITSGIPWDVTSGNVISSASTQVQVKGATSTVSECLVVAVSTTAREVSPGQYSAWANANLTSVSEVADVATTDGEGGTIGVATGSKATAGSYGTTTAILIGVTNARQANMTIALRPPATPPPGSGTSQNPVHTFTSAGTYSVTLVILDNDNNSASTTSNVHVS